MRTPYTEAVTTLLPALGLALLAAAAPCRAAAEPRMDAGGAVFQLPAPAYWSAQVPEAPEPAADPDRIANPWDSSWPVVSGNAMAAETGRAAALPEGIASWSMLDGWQKPKSYRVNYYVKNGFGMKAIDFSFRLGFSYGGSLNGRGRYLAEVSLAPESVTVYPGYRLDAEARVESAAVVNVGTHEDPVAGMQVKLLMTMASPGNQWTGTAVFYVDGTGRARELADPAGGAKSGAENSGYLTFKEAE